MTAFTAHATLRTSAVLIFALFTLPAVAADFRGRGFDITAPIVGKTWVGEDASATVERTVSVEQWESILGGKAERTTASVNNGELGHQLTFYVDPTNYLLSFHGVSTDGAYTKGTLETIINGKMVWKEKVIGSPYLNLVKLTFTLLPDGNMKSSSEYFKDNKTVPGGHEFNDYVAPDTKLVFASEAK